MKVFKSKQDIKVYQENKRKELAKVVDAVDFTTHSVLVRDLFGTDIYHIIQSDFDGYTVSYQKGREAFNYLTGTPHLKQFKVVRFKEPEWLATVELVKVYERTSIDKEPDEDLVAYVGEEGEDE